MVRAASHAAIPGESGCTPGVHRRRRPERTLAWQTVQGWLATWIAHHDEADAEPVPAHVQRELSAYLECDILAYGFTPGALSGLYCGVPRCLVIRAIHGAAPAGA